MLFAALFGVSLELAESQTVFCLDLFLQTASCLLLVFVSCLVGLLGVCSAVLLWALFEVSLVFGECQTVFCLVSFSPNRLLFVAGFRSFFGRTARGIFGGTFGAVLGLVWHSGKPNRFMSGFFFSKPPPVCW